MRQKTLSLGHMKHSKGIETIWDLCAKFIVDLHDSDESDVCNGQFISKISDAIERSLIGTSRCAMKILSETICRMKPEQCYR